MLHNLLDPRVRQLKERSERLTGVASEAYDHLKTAKESYGEAPSTAQKGALDTLQAEYDRAAGEARGAESELKDSFELSGSDDGGKGAPAKRVGELRSYGIGDDLRHGARAEGATVAQIVRAMATGDHRALEGYSLMSSGASGAVPEYETLGIVEQAMQESVIFSAGARVIPMSAPSVRVARITSTPTVELKPEADNRDLTDQGFTFEPAQMDAYSAFLYTTSTLEALEDVVNLEETIVNVFARQLALAWDKYGLGGAGNDDPLGVGMMFPADGAGEVNASGATIAGYGPFIKAVGLVRAAHHAPSAVVLDVPTWTSLAMLTATDEQPLVPPKAYQGLAEYVSDFMPLTTAPVTSSAVVGDFSRLIVGVRTSLQIEFDRLGAGFKSGKVAIRGYMRWGSFVDDPTAFAVVRGITNAA